MAIQHDVSSLIDNVKLFQSLPDSATAFTDDDILQFMNYELQNTIVPLILNLRSEHLVFDKLYNFAPGNTTITIDIPPEAAGSKLRDVQYLDQDGYFYNIPWLAPEQIGDYNLVSFWNSNNASANNYFGFFGVYIMNNQLKFYPEAVLNNTTIKLTYHRRLADLCLTTDAGQITSIVGNYITIDNINAAWNTSSTFDFITGTPPYWYVPNSSFNTNSGYSAPIPLVNVPVVAISGSTYQFDPITIASLKVGDWISTSGYSPWIQYLPTEAEGCLVQATSAKVLEALSDEAGLNAAIVKYNAMAKDLERLLCPRIEGRPKKMVNTGGILNNTRFRTSRFSV